MGPIRKALLAATAELPMTGLQPAHRERLVAAAQVYRKHWWSSHDRANREWVADPLSKIASLSPVVPDRLSKLYGTPWFTRTVRSMLFRSQVVRINGEISRQEAIEKLVAAVK